MIRLAGSAIDKYEIEFTHPEQTGSGFVEYSFNHNRGKEPNSFNLAMDYTSTGVFARVEGRSITPSNVVNGLDYFTTQELNTTKFRLFRLGAGTFDMKLELFWF